MRKNYRNAIPGDQTSELIQTVMTAEELAVHEKAFALEMAIHRGKLARLELDELQANCKHPVFHDTDPPGDTRNVRYCTVCGAQLS